MCFWVFALCQHWFWGIRVSFGCWSEDNIDLHANIFSKMYILLTLQSANEWEIVVFPMVRGHWSATPLDTKKRKIWKREIEWFFAAFTNVSKIKLLYVEPNMTSHNDIIVFRYTRNLLFLRKSAPFFKIAQSTFTKTPNRCTNLIEHIVTILTGPCWASNSAWFLSYNSTKK